MSDNTPPSGPEGQDPNANPYGQQPQQPPYGQNPYGQQPPAGQDPYGQSSQQPPYGQNPYGQDPYGQPTGQNPYDQNPYGQDPYGQQQFGQPQYGTPQPPSYSVGAAFSWAWGAFRANAGTFVLLTLLLGAISAVVQVSGNLIFPSTTTTVSGVEVTTLSNGASQVVSLITQIATLVVTAALLRASFNVFDGKPVSVGSSFSGISWVNLIGVAVLTAVAVTLGLFLLVLPGLVAAVLLAFGPAFVVDRDVNAVAALKGSFQLVTKKPGSVLLYMLACVGVVIVGFLACFVGLLVAVPLVTLAQAYTYRALGYTVTTN